MMKKTFGIIALLTAIVSIFTSCNTRNNSLTSDEGVVMNGVRWATRNVDKFGTFAESPEDAGMLYQWNRRRGWNNTDRAIPIGWDETGAEGTTWYTVNDPCPTGWRVPTSAELRSLNSVGSVWATQNGINGRLFGIAPNHIFLPSAGFRNFQGILVDVGTQGSYWSMTSAVRNAENLWWRLNFGDSSNVGNTMRANASSIRCVAE